MRVRLILCFIVIVMSWGVAVALTPSEIYKEHKSDIRQGEFFIYDEHLFIVIRVKTNTSDAGKRALFIKMKVKALKSVLPRFAHFQFPDADTAWFEIYFSEPVNSRFTIRQAFVVDKRIADGEAYLVLTVPRGKVESYIPDITAIKNTVNRAFDEGKPINLKKYIDVVDGDRLLLVQEAIEANLPQVSENEKNSLGNSDNENFNMKDQFKDPFEGTTIRESNKLDDML